MFEFVVIFLVFIFVFGIGFVFVVYIYYKFYKYFVFKKMFNVFEFGDFVFDLVVIGKDFFFFKIVVVIYWIECFEQFIVDEIVVGKEVGYYYFFIGEKGIGKFFMFFEVMCKIDGDGVVMFEVYVDFEIFCICFGKVLDYEFYEDYMGSYFFECGFCDIIVFFDIECVFNKVEKVVFKRWVRVGRLLVIIIN